MNVWNTAFLGAPVEEYEKTVQEIEAHCKSIRDLAGRLSRLRADLANTGFDVTITPRQAAPKDTHTSRSAADYPHTS